jgi:hypothetical protein
VIQEEMVEAGDGDLVSVYREISGVDYSPFFRITFSGRPVFIGLLHVSQRDVIGDGMSHIEYSLQTVVSPDLALNPVNARDPVRPFLS